jgi:hypothetical protein
MCDRTSVRGRTKPRSPKFKKLSGTHFDPTLVDHFVPMLNQLRENFPGNAFDNHLSQAGDESEFLQARDRIHEMLADTEALLNDGMSSEHFKRTIRRD